MIRGRIRVGSQPFVEGDSKGEEFLAAVEGVDHLDVEFGMLEGGFVEVLNVVKKIAGEGGVGLDAGGLEAEVGVVLADLLVDGGALDGEGVERNVDRLGAAQGEDAAVQLVLGCRGDLVVVGGDELHAGVFEREGMGGVVRVDDADRQDSVLEVGHAEERALLLVVAGLGGYRDMLAGVGVVGGYSAAGLAGGAFLSAAKARGARQRRARQPILREKAAKDRAPGSSCRLSCLRWGFIQARLSSSLIRW